MIPLFDIKTTFDLSNDPGVIRVEDLAFYDTISPTQISSVVTVTSPVGLLPSGLIDNDFSLASSDIGIPIDYAQNAVTGIYNIHVKTTIIDQVFAYSVQDVYGTTVSGLFNTFTIQGNATAFAPTVITIIGSTGNDGTYNVVGITYDATTDKTLFQVASVPPSTVADGELAFILDQDYENDYEYDFCYKPVEIDISTVSSCSTSELYSKDVTQYGEDVLNFSRIHTVMYPRGIDPQPANIVSPLQSVNVFPIYTKTWTTTIETTIEYLIGNLNVIDVLVGSKDHYVECAVNFCKLYDCLKNFYQRLLIAKKENPTEATRLEREWIRLSALYELAVIADKCGKNTDARCFFEEMQTILSSNGCSCECAENESESPKLIESPFPSTGNSGDIIVTAPANNGISVNAVTTGSLTDFQLSLDQSILSGLQGPAGADGSNGAAGSQWYQLASPPNPLLGVDNDYYINSALVNYPVFKKINGLWTFQFDLVPLTLPTTTINLFTSTVDNFFTYNVFTSTVNILTAYGYAQVARVSRNRTHIEGRISFSTDGLTGDFKVQTILDMTVLLPGANMQVFPAVSKDCRLTWSQGGVIGSGAMQIEVGNATTLQINQKESSSNNGITIPNTPTQLDINFSFSINHQPL